MSKQTRKARSKMLAQRTTDVILRNGRPCMREFYDAVRYQAAACAAALSTDKQYTARAVCGEPFWRLLGTPGLRQQAGRCLAHLVASGSIGLVFASPERKWPRRYRLPYADTSRPQPRPYVSPIPDTNT